MTALFVGVGILGAVRETRAGGDVAWAKNFQEGVTQARQSHKLLMLSFHAPGCGWCAKLDAETFTDPKVVELSRRCVCVRLDSDVDTAQVQRYHVEEYPTILFADSEGKELARISAYVPPEQFAKGLSDLENAYASSH